MFTKEAADQIKQGLTAINEDFEFETKQLPKTGLMLCASKNVIHRSDLESIMELIDQINDGLDYRVSFFFGCNYVAYENPAINFIGRQYAPGETPAVQ